ncbi:MAG: hypothetical protein QXZ70_03920, partial [Candidatus Bathyarchaeia archaeon]
NLPSASSWLKKMRQIRSHVPSCDHSFKRRQQVVSEPYSGGKSTTRFQHIQDAVQGLSVVIAGTPPLALLLGDERFEHRQLFVTEVMPAYAFILPSPGIFEMTFYSYLAFQRINRNETQLS